MRPLSLPFIGNRSQGFALTFVSSSMPLYLDFALFQVGKFVGVVTLGGNRNDGVPDVVQLRALTQAAVGKLMGHHVAPPKAPGGVPAPYVELPPGFYLGKVDSIDPASSYMTYTIASALCGSTHSGTWTISFRGATFESNGDSLNDQAVTQPVSQAQWIAEAQTWKSWNLDVSAGNGLTISDGPYGPCGL
jgi:hypothetical protein